MCFDIDSKKSQILAEKFKCKQALSVDEILESKSLEAVIIATTHDTLAQISGQAIKYGKHVFIEKPGAINLEEFQRIVQKKMSSPEVKIHIGYNHRFGKNREGSFTHLKEFAPNYGFEINEISEQDIDQISVSSTRIREALVNGEVAKAARFLGRSYLLSGIVMEGKQLGRTIGFPTANIHVNDLHKLIPHDGVYAVRVNIGDQKFGGMLNIGNNPSIEGKGRTIEVNIFNFSETIYNQRISIEFVDKLRNEVKFINLDALKTQLQCDKLQAMEVLV
jgi:riboflavin kinase/FMN adenylyltransferase